MSSIESDNTRADSDQIARLEAVIAELKKSLGDVFKYLDCRIQQSIAGISCEELSGNVVKLAAEKSANAELVALNAFFNNQLKQTQSEG